MASAQAPGLEISQLGLDSPTVKVLTAENAQLNPWLCCGVRLARLGKLWCLGVPCCPCRGGLGQDRDGVAGLDEPVVD